MAFGDIVIEVDAEERVDDIWLKFETWSLVEILNLKSGQDIEALVCSRSLSKLDSEAEIFKPTFAPLFSHKLKDWHDNGEMARAPISMYA